MASNSEANLSSDFDIDEVINWDEQNYSSKGIEFQLTQLGLPNDAKTSTVTLPNLGSTPATSQQTSLQSAQNTSSFYSSLFGAANNPSVGRNPKNHGYQSRQAMVSPSALSFPSGNINIPAIATPSSNSSLLEFAPNLTGRNASLASQFSVPPLQNVQNSGDLMNDGVGVSPFTDHGIDGSTHLIEGPLDRIVDQIMERQISEGIIESPALSSSYDDDTPVITYSNIQAKEPSVQLSSSASPQNVPSRNVLSPNTSSRNVTSPNLPTQNVPSQNLPMHRIPSPSAPTRNVASPVNTSQSVLSPTPPSSRNVQVQKISSTKILPPNISPPNVPSQNVKSQNMASPHGLQPGSGISYSIPTQSHSKFRLQTPTSVPSSMVNALGQSTLNGPPTSTVTSLPISLEQTELPTNSLLQTSSAQPSLFQASSYPSFLLQNANQTLMHQISVTTNFSPSSTQAKPVWMQSSNNLEELLRMQRNIRAPSPNIEQKETTNQLTRSSPAFSSVLTNKIGSEHSQSTMPSFINTNAATERSTANVSSLFTADASTSDLKITSVSSPISKEPQASSMNLSAQNITTGVLQYNQTSPSCSESVTNQLQNSVPQSVTYPGQVVSNFLSNTLSSSLQSDALQKTSIGHLIQNQQDVLETTQALNSPGPGQQIVTSVNQFFHQNSSDVNQTTVTEKLFPNNVSQTQNIVLSNNPSLTKGKLLVTTEMPLKTQQSQSKSVFTLVPPSTLSQANTHAMTVNSPSLLFSPKPQENPVNTTQPAGITTIRITSPSANTAGFKYPSVPTVGFGPSPPPKAVSFQPPRAAAIRIKSPTNITSTAFPSFRLTQASLGTSTNSPNTRPMVFTLAPGSQAAATLKGLPSSFKDKLTGRQVIFLQQPSGQPINTPKPQPMKIIFVNDNSIAQLVSGPVKSKVAQSSTIPVASQTPGQAAVSNVITSSTESKCVPLTTAESLAVNESEAGSPSSVNSADSDFISIAALKQSEVLKKEKESTDGTDHKSRGRKRRKDPNRPVKPLSSFQRFFQAQQAIIRQQDPQATFPDVSKTIKEMWENLPSKDKKVYQDAWRMERVEYKKAMDEYNASLNTIDSDAPSPKQAKHIIEIKDDIATTNQIPVSPVDIPIKTEISTSTVVRLPTSPTVTSPYAATSSAVVSSSVQPVPRSSGKPLAMMAELANKTKLASAQAAAKATGMAKSLHMSKSKTSNGIEEGITLKKKAKINPLPKKSCIRSHCAKPAKTTKERGTMFCSDDCVMRHCRGIFKSWVEARRETLKAAT